MTKLKYFIDCKTIEDVRKTYKDLLFKFHPDLSSNPFATEICQELNNEYDSVYLRLKHVHTNASGETYTTDKEPTETAKEYADIINKLIHFTGCTIEIIGSWIWVSGNTKEYKEQIKAINGFRWSKSKLSWYYHNEPYHKKSSKTLSLDDIRNMFGSQNVQTVSKQALAH